MKISTRGRYALRFFIYLASQNNDKVSLKEVALHEEISMKYLEQIVPNLAKDKLIYSTRGAKGGYSLTKNPSEYCVLEILESVEGKMEVVSCVNKTGTASCHRLFKCKTAPLWKGLTKHIVDYLKGVTLEDLLINENEYL